MVTVVEGETKKKQGMLKMFNREEEYECYVGWSGHYERKKKPGRVTFIDLRDMPNFNSAITDNIDSISAGRVKIIGGCPHCVIHGAMNKVSWDGIWRCLICGVGCYQMVESST